MSLAKHIRLLTGSCEISLVLYSVVLELSRSVLRDFSSATDEAEDLAGDFLVWLSEQGNLTVRSKKTLKSLIRRFWSRRNSPASHELWGILSEALKALSVKGVAHRIDAAADAANSNGALWSAVARDRDGVPFDPIAFVERAQRIPTYPKDREGDKRVARGGKLLSPGDAKELALALLQAAEAPIEMGSLHTEACRHVLLLQIEIPSRQGDEAGGNGPGPAVIESHSDGEASRDGETFHGPLTIDDEVLIQAEAKALAARIWNRLAELPAGEAPGARELVCDYVIPKFLRHSRATLEQFGAPQRVKEQVDKILAEVGSLASISEACGDPDQRWRLENLLELAMELVGSDYCPLLSDGFTDIPENPAEGSFPEA